MSSRDLVLATIAAVAAISGACTVDPTQVVVPPPGDGGGTGGIFGSRPDEGAGGQTTPEGDGGVVDAPVVPNDGKCEGTGTKALGAACVCGGDCSSNFCADGICCNTACSGACVSCSLPDSMGECTVVDLGLPDPHGFCKKAAPESCLQDGTCNGLGGCSKFKAGTSCGKTSCSGSGLLPAASCDGNGNCQAGTPINCAPSMCDAGACKLICASNADCVSPAICNNGSCGPRPLGVPCDKSTQCKSGFCTDGVCCDSVCNGKCSYCALPTSPGRCVPVPANVADPRAAAGVTDATRICVDMKAASCGTNGKCDGNGGCQRYPEGTVCKNQSCNATSNRFTPKSTCSGGSCVSPASSLCTPFKCTGTRCATSCAANTDCTTNNTCLAGSCGKKPQGAVCGKDAECGSKFCAQGVCCNERCGGVCQTCNLNSSRGVCVAVPLGGSDPSNTCVATDPTGCGNDGTCNGSGGCNRFASGTQCKAASCTTGVITLTSRCDGRGACKAGGTRSCGGFACDPSAAATCLNNCNDDNQCVGVRCLASKCGLSGAGGPCESNGDCQTGGGLSCWRSTVCCKSACLGDCEACDTGTCAPVPAGQSPPHGGCAPSQDTCGNTGTCDGRAACSLGLAAGAVCSGRCDMNNNSIITTCRGGSCSASTTKTCNPQVCSGQGSCNPCSVDGDCSAGNVCDNGVCKAARNCDGAPTRSCGMCGTQTRVCNAVTGVFGEFGPCMGEHGSCMPGATRPCPSGGGTQTCLASCDFPAPSVCNCTPATTCPMGQNCDTASDGCSGTLQCGSCSSPQTCGGGGVPGHCGCTPRTTCPMGQDCGSADDGCGGTVMCGNCTAPRTCGGGGTSNQCGCTPRTTCPMGQDCGTADDGCGGTIPCGSCGTPDTCGGGGTPGHCGCRPSVSCPSNQTCGTVDDGCGHTINCGPNGGGCPGGVACDTATNPPSCPCVPSTCPAGQECGSADDGCGHTLNCGTCPAAKPMCQNTPAPPHCICQGLATCPATAECGSISDGCTGTINCGECTLPQVCGTGPNANKCVDP